MVGYRLVWADTGKLVPNQKRYTVREGVKGRKSIYKDDKFVGYVTKFKNDEIEQLAWESEGRRVNRLDKWFDSSPKSAFRADSIGYESLHYRTLADQWTTIAHTGAASTPFRVQSDINYARYLRGAVDAGCITDREAQEWFQKYKDAKNDDERTDLWARVKTFALGEGYADSY